MSYIRSTSNPESLYIFGNMNNFAEIHQGEKYIGRVPTSLFNQLIDKYVDDYDDNTEVEDEFNGGVLRIKEIWVDGDLKMELSHPKIDTLIMWGVTWETIVRTNYGRSKPRWKRKRIKKIAKI